MATTTTRRKKKYSKKKLIARLEVLTSKEELTKEEEEELQDILNRLGRKQKDKLNIAAQNDSKAVQVIINNNVSTTGKREGFVTSDHFSSAAGTYRKARIDNRKNKNKDWHNYGV